MRTKCTALIAKLPSMSLNNTNVFPGLSTPKQNLFKKFELCVGFELKTRFVKTKNCITSFSSQRKYLNEEKLLLHLMMGEHGVYHELPLPQLKELNISNFLIIWSCLLPITDNTQPDNHASDNPMRRYPFRNTTKTNKFQARQ